jgi:MbtH protein
MYTDTLAADSNRAIRISLLQRFESLEVFVPLNDSIEEDSTPYKVVVNHEEQYSIWPVDRENPKGWRDVGRSGTKAECLAYIKEVWTDMRPLSVRNRIAG